MQRAAAEAVEIGMKLVDDQVIKRRTHKIKIGTGKDATTEIKVNRARCRRWRWWPSIRIPAKYWHWSAARNYGMSQLNHAMAKRPTGSIFKPFVYAAAINTAVTGQNWWPMPVRFR